MRLPRGIREEPGWVFIGVVCALVGVSYLVGFSQSTVTLYLDVWWLRVWGAVLFLTGMFVAAATTTRNRPLERLALRLLALGLLVYVGWIVVAVPERSAMTVFLSLTLIVSSQIRVAVLGVLFDPPFERASKE